MFKLPPDIAQSVITCASFGGAFEVNIARGNDAWSVYRRHPDPIIYARVGMGRKVLEAWWDNVEAFNDAHAKPFVQAFNDHASAMLREVATVEELEREALQMRARMERQGAELTQANDMLSDARQQLDALRDALNVPVEPHQSLNERMLERVNLWRSAVRRLVAVYEELAK